MNEGNEIALIYPPDIYDLIDITVHILKLFISELKETMYV